MTREDLRQLALTLRDLCEHTGAKSSSLNFDSAIVVYVEGQGVTVCSNGGAPVLLSDDVLDDVGLVPAITWDVDDLALAHLGALTPTPNRDGS